LPWDFGKKGSMRAICASVSQNRLLMSPLAFRPLNHEPTPQSMGPDPNQTRTSSMNSVSALTGCQTPARRSGLGKSLNDMVLSHGGYT
jgi:hypothetical protein